MKTAAGRSPGADCDVLIAGGGMVGASLAVALAGLPLRVLLIEAIPAGSPGQPSFDARTTALSRSSQHILKALGIWPAVAVQASPIHRIHVSERGRLGTAVIDADDDGGEPLGYVVENRLLGAELWRVLAGSPNITVHSPATVTAVIDPADADVLQVQVEKAGAISTIRTRLLVVADGARSTLRGSLGIAARTRPYAQVAIVGNAAHGLHPVAGQGYNLGLRDSAALVELVAAEMRRTDTWPDAGRESLLAAYANWRRPDQRKVVAFTDGLIRLFNRRDLGPLRGLGLLLFDTAPGAKRLLARETMGLAGRRTRLARGLMA